MTTIDKTGKIVSQVMENYVDRKESDIFAAIAKQIIHFKSDITTSMGLPAPSGEQPQKKVIKLNNPLFSKVPANS